MDIDDLSDGQMESLDKALGSAFQEFRKARPVRKNNNKLPKDQTALMHFRLRCLDLIEVLTDKELSISLSAAAMMPLLSLLEVTVKEPLQKPLMDRTKSVLRKLTNIRRFTDSSDVRMEDLVKLLQILFSKPYASKFLLRNDGIQMLTSSYFLSSGCRTGFDAVHWRGFGPVLLVHPTVYFTLESSGRSKEGRPCQWQGRAG